MPQVSGYGRLSSVFVFRTYDNGIQFQPQTRGYNFINATISDFGGGIVNIDVAGGGGGASWNTLGNAGSGFLLGTTSVDDWSFISSGLSRGGFKFSGEFFLKTHAGFTGSEVKTYTSVVGTTDATFNTLFAIPITDLTNNFITVSAIGRRSTGADRCVFERKVMVSREGAGAVITGGVTTTFTEKTVAGYNIQISVSGNNLLVEVRGAAAQTLSWTGTVTMQGVSTAA